MMIRMKTRTIGIIERIHVALEEPMRKHNFTYEITEDTEDGLTIVTLTSPTHKIPGTTIIRMASAGLYVKELQINEPGVLKVKVDLRSGKE